MRKPKQLSREDQEKLDNLEKNLEKELEHFIGYPCNTLFDYSALYHFLKLPLNNIGDPYVPTNYHINTHEFERDVIDIFKKLTNAPKKTTWGYVTNGGTEGNLYGIFLAREMFPDCMVYYSEDSHYSVNKILRCLHVRNIMIRSNPDGTMNLDDLRETIKIHRDVPPVIFANIGSTMKGACDDLLGIQKILKDLAIKRHYIHADAALSGMILPFLDKSPAWDFDAGIDSVSISGHKMVGSPLPCGVVLAKKEYVDRIACGVEYVGTLDTTIMGSRNGLTPLFLWYAFRTIGIEGFHEIIQSCMSVAAYAETKLNALNRHAWKHPNSLTVVFDRPSPTLVSKWQLASKGSISHLIAMPHVTCENIDELAEDLAGEKQDTRKNRNYPSTVRRSL